MSDSCEQEVSYDDKAKVQGWWRNRTIGAVDGINPGGPYILSLNQYIFVDTSISPIQIQETWGTKKYPRLQPDFLDPEPYPIPSLPNPTLTPQSFYLKKDESGKLDLINVYNSKLKGAVNPDLSYNVGATFKLQDDGTLQAFEYANYNYFGSISYLPFQVFEKMDTAPIDTTNLDWNDPVMMFKYYVSALSSSNSSTNLATKGTNYVGPKRAKKILKQFYAGTFEKTTPIWKIRATNTTVYNAAGISADKWTTLYTGNKCKGKFSSATHGSTVYVKGGTDRFAKLNGTYENGVAAFNSSANLKLKQGWVDKGPDGSFQDLFFSLLLNLDTSCLQDLADPLTGWIILPPGITITVKHHVHSNMKYHELAAASMAWFYATFHTGTHIEQIVYTYDNSARIIGSFQELKTLLARPQGANSQLEYVRFGQSNPNFFYHNAVPYLNYPLINCPYPLYQANINLQYEVPAANYLEEIYVLVWTIRGVLESDQPDPVATFGYPFINDPTAGRAHFESLVLQTTVIDGIIQVPAYPSGYTTIGDWGPDIANVNSYYFGIINPKLTERHKIGYLYKRDCDFCDPINLMTNCGVYAPETPNKSKNPRIFREGLSQVYSKMMLLFKQKSIEAFILDQTGNLGGAPDIISLSEFFGDDRLMYTTATADAVDIDLLHSFSKANVVNQASRKPWKLGSETALVELNEKLYPGSVFHGTEKQEFPFIFMTDIFAFSFGDISPNLFLGENGDGNLGHNTQMHLVGCIDGREFGFADFSPNLPVNSNTKYLDVNGNPVSAISFSLDGGSFFLEYSKNKLSQFQQHQGVKPTKTKFKGQDGGNALPISYEKTLFEDQGWTPRKRKYLSGWKEIHSTPPDPNDPTTWTFLYLDAAIDKAIKELTQGNRCFSMGEIDALEMLW